MAQPVNASMVGDLVKRSANVGGLQEKKKFWGEVGGEGHETQIWHRSFKIEM